MRFFDDLEDADRRPAAAACPSSPCATCRATCGSPNCTSVGGHAVNALAAIEAALHEREDVRHALRRVRLEQLDLDRALRGLERRRPDRPAPSVCGATARRHATSAAMPSHDRARRRARRLPAHAYVHVYAPNASSTPIFGQSALHHARPAPRIDRPAHVLPPGDEIQVHVAARTGAAPRGRAPAPSGRASSSAPSRAGSRCGARACPRRCCRGSRATGSARGSPSCGRRRAASAAPSIVDGHAPAEPLEDLAARLLHVRAP